MVDKKFSELISSRESITEELIDSVSGSESKRFGGYHSNFSGNKGLRVGLLEAKHVIRNTSPCFVTKQSNNDLTQELVSFVGELSNAWFELIEDTRPKTFIGKLINLRFNRDLSALNASLLDSMTNLNKLITDNTGADTRNLYSVIAERKEICDLISQILRDSYSAQLESDSEGKYKNLLVAIEEHALVKMKSFIEVTKVNVEFCDLTFLKHCISGVYSEEAKYQQLPGDEGLYEIVGLKGVASRLEYILEKKYESRG